MLQLVHVARAHQESAVTDDPPLIPHRRPNDRDPHRQSLCENDPECFNMRMQDQRIGRRYAATHISERNSPAHSDPWWQARRRLAANHIKLDVETTSPQATDRCDNLGPAL